MHFVEGSELYTLHDLMEVQAGRLLEDIRTIIAIFAKHIKDECLVSSCFPSQ